ncbi:hypothetical protein D1872_293890 [compost metagenome]
MLPPTLNGKVVVCHVLPRSVERKIDPLFLSQEFVYVPTAKYTRSGSTGSVASASTPFLFQSSHPTKSVSGIQLSFAGFQR